METSQEISLFTSQSTEEPTENAQSWDAVPELEIPDALKKLENKGTRFIGVPFFTATSQTRVTKDRSIYFNVDTLVTSQLILEAFDAAGIDIDNITGIQRKASNKSWVVTFVNRAAKETALETPHVEIAGLKVFLGDCENRLTLVKIYDAPAEMPDTALIGRLSHYGQVLSFRRDKIARNIDNGIRTARMVIHRTIPSYMNVAGEIIRAWYPNQPKTCRNCGADDHMAKDCSSVRCFNCERPGHRARDCTESTKCSVCMADDHEIPSCPFVLFSANVNDEPRQEKSQEEKNKEKEERKAKRMEEKRQQEERQERQQQQQQQQQELQREQEEQERRKHKEKRQHKDDNRKKERARESESEGRRDNRTERRENRKDERRDDRYHRDYHYHERDRSSRRDPSETETDDDEGWQKVSHRRRRHRY